MKKIKLQAEAQMDTHAVIGVLKTKYKLSSRTAEAIVYTVQKSQESHSRNLVTKTDLANFRTEIMNYLNKHLADLRGDMSTFKEEMNKNMSTFKEDINKNMSTSKEDMNKNMSTFKEDVNKSLSNFKMDLIKWIIGNNIVLLLFLLAIIRLI